MNITEFSRFAIIQTAFIGDVVLTLSVADAIKSIHPSAEIHFITTPVAASLAESTDSIDYVHVFDKRGKHKSLLGILSFAESLSSKSIECVLSPHRSLRTTLISKLIKPKYSVGFTVNALSWLYSKRVEYPIHIHEVERNLRLLSVFDETNKLWLQKAPRPQVTISHVDTQEVLKLLDREFSHKPSSIIALAPGSVWNTKRWIEDNFIKTAIELQKKDIHVYLSVE
ncbi:MAG: glycosyltransferase family 9 protein [Ignavibacteria bacterium]|nr:glycosyltransferase family 9 protein [Ignavibacteria bacterium]